MTALPSGPGLPVDLMITDTTIVTMDASRRIIKDGAIAIKGDIIAAVGKSADVKRDYVARETIDGRRFVITPGLVNTHVHITGEPLTKGVILDDTGFEENVFQWLVPIHMAYTPEDEQLSAKYAALEMMRSGTTCFLEAGTIRFLDPVVEALKETGIRGRVGQWAWDFSPEDQSYPTTATDAAIGLLTDEISRHPADGDQRIAAWPILIGHVTCSGTLWQAAKALADRHGVGVAAHMSPAQSDPDWYMARYGQRPIEYLAGLGAIGANTIFTHGVHFNGDEVGLLASLGANVSHCATSALKGAYGATAVGLFPEMQAQGVNVTIGTDGNNNSNYHDAMRATYLVAGLFKDARRDPALFPAETAYECATVNGAKALQMSDRIGSLEVGKKADFVAHDTDRPEWRPLFNVINQLVWAADGRGVHSVWIDGVRVVDNYRCTTIDEDKIYAEVQAAGEAIIARSGLPIKSRWPVV
jgi:cytosine/adenosine deaminase-related metal-dependent hydrolase